MVCCPEGSAPYLANGHVNTGQVINVGGFPCYATGVPDSTRALIVASDVWGWNGGRTRALADHLAAALNAYVLVPRLLDAPPLEGGTDGDGLPPGFSIEARMKDFADFVRGHPWTSLSKKLDAILAHVDGKPVGMVGFCWGGWFLCQASAHSTALTCGVIAHPSVGLEEMIFKGSNVEVARRVQCPLLLMPAGNDPPIYLPGGNFFETLKAAHPATKAVPFPAMAHGWVPRGDLSDAYVRRDVDAAVQLMVKYFKEHLSIATARL